jgi:hypothetical protein
MGQKLYRSRAYSHRPSCGRDESVAVRILTDLEDIRKLYENILAMLSEDTPAAVNAGKPRVTDVETPRWISSAGLLLPFP